MSELTLADAATGADQASGLRRLFDRLPANWTLVLQPPVRGGNTSESLAARARLLALHRGPTLVIDASRSQVAAALGMRLRYDLAHAMAGDCEFGAACAGAGGGLWVLPAARALDEAIADEQQGRRLAETLQAAAVGMREVVFLLPSSRIAWASRFAPFKGLREAVIPVYGSAETATAVLTTIRQAMGELDIGTFRLLFLGMGEATASRLLSALAAIARRHFGAVLLAASPVAEERPAGRDEAPSGRDRGRVVERLF